MELLSLSSAMIYAHNSFFRGKLVLLAVAGLNMAIFHLVGMVWGTTRHAPPAAKIAGALSLAVWASVVAFGRLTRERRGIRRLARTMGQNSRSLSMAARNVFPLAADKESDPVPVDTRGSDARSCPREPLASYRVDSSFTDESVVIALMVLLSLADCTLRA
jgi:hypothetical protein